MLVDAHAHETFALKTLLRQLTFIDFGDVFELAARVFGEQPFALESESFGIAFEISPDLDLAFGTVRHSFYAARLEFGIEPRKIV